MKSRKPRNLEKTSNSSQSTCPVGRVLWEELLEELRHIIYYSLIIFFAYAFKRQVHVFSGQVKIVSYSSCRTCAILKYFCPLLDIQSTSTSANISNLITCEIVGSLYQLSLGYCEIRLEH